MWKEGLQKIFTMNKRSSEERRGDDFTDQCVGYLDPSRRFQYTTFQTALEKERIMRDLQRSGNLIYGVMDRIHARRLVTVITKQGDELLHVF